MSVQMPSRMQLTRKYIDNKVLDQPQMAWAMIYFWFQKLDLFNGFQVEIKQSTETETETDTEWT